MFFIIHKNFTRKDNSLKLHDLIKARKMILINKVLYIFVMWLLRQKYVVVAQGPQKYCHIKIMSENKKALGL